MSHKTMIDGVAYEVSGGKTLVDGTAYSIKNGKTLVGGTAYEVGFGEAITVSILPDIVSGHNPDYARVTIDGEVYDGTNTVNVSVKAGTAIECYIYVQNCTSGGISVDGEMKVSGTTGTYKHIVTKDCSIKVGYVTIKIFSSVQIYGVITITTET